MERGEHSLGKGGKENEMGRELRTSERWGIEGIGEGGKDTYGQRSVEGMMEGVLSLSHLVEEIPKSDHIQRGIKEGSTDIKKTRRVDEKENKGSRLERMEDGRLEEDSGDQGWKVEGRTPMQDCTNLEMKLIMGMI